jgi:hypothetical protein
MCFADEVPKPPCNAVNHGRLWPEAANSSPDVAGQLSRSGELEMCTVSIWKYRWKRLTVDIRELEKGHPAAAKSSETSAAR